MCNTLCMCLCAVCYVCVHVYQVCLHARMQNVCMCMCVRMQWMSMCRLQNKEVSEQSKEEAKLPVFGGIPGR